jgi:hypothetical protein
MVKKLNYGDRGILATTNNKKMLRKNNTNKEREDSNVEVRSPSLQLPSLRFGGDVRCHEIAQYGATSIICFRVLSLLFKKPFISKP